jgi:hypothetical protein
MTFAPAIVFAYASVTRTDGFGVTLVATVSVVGGPATTASALAGPGTPTAVRFADNAPSVAMREFVPAVFPSVHAPGVATPSAPLAALAFTTDPADGVKLTL